MNFEKTPPIKTEETVGKLYPERPFLRVDREIEKLKMLESGEMKKIELTDEERRQVLEYEDALGEELEKISDKRINSQIFYPEYFLTDGGRAEFVRATGLEMVGDDAEEIERFLLRNRVFLGSVDGKKLSELAGKSIAFNDERVAESIGKTMNENGEIRIDGLENPTRIRIVLNPDDAYEKIQNLRRYKREVSEMGDRIEGRAKASDNVEIARGKIRDLYRKKINVMIASQATYGVWASELASFFGVGGLTDGEKKLKETVPGLLKFEEIFSRYDRFVHGAAVEYDEAGMRRQIGKALLDYADEIGKTYSYNQLRKHDLIREKGLDPEKIEKRDIDVETFSRWAEELLDFYGRRSDFPAWEYDPKRNGPAPDNGWQFVAREQYKSMSVNSKQKIIKSGVKNKSITEALGTMLGHEFAHFIQAENKAKIPLRIFSDKLGGFRSAVFSEGGAMNIENEVDKELFGYERSAHPHYIRAMVRKLEGGTYLDCVKAFYDDGLAIIRKRKDLGIIKERDFFKEAEDLLDLSINRVKRLFAGDDRFDRSETYLTESGDTVYAEQMIVMKRLEENGLRKCSLVSGVNLDTLAILVEIGLIDLKKIEEPDLNFIRKIWEQEKHKYELNR